MKESRIGITMGVITPKVPNYLQIVGAANARIDVAELSVEDLKRLGERWTEALIENSTARLEARKTTPCLSVAKERK